MLRGYAGTPLDNILPSTCRRGKDRRGIGA
jgi:hypothetical protein